MPDSGRELLQRWRPLAWGLVFAMLALSFWFSDGWLTLCAGLALFLFGMQCLEDGLRQLAGGQLERLLALAGQNISLGPLALPLLVFGVLGSFTGPRGQAIGRVVMGVAFLFLGIDQMKAGFSVVAGAFDPLQYQLPGIAGALLFTGVGLLVTVVLQSSHATLMLTLAALAGGQLALEQSLAIAIGSNLGSTVTAVIGALGGARAGQRLALAHVLFNLTTGVLALLLLVPLAALVQVLTAPLGLGDNVLIQLALFHSLFNAMGVALFWPWQGWLAGLL